MRPVRRGDYFLLPYAGRRRLRLVKAMTSTPFGAFQWNVQYCEGKHTGIALLSVCQRCSPSLAKRITGKEKP